MKYFFFCKKEKMTAKCIVIIQESDIVEGITIKRFDTIKEAVFWYIRECAEGIEGEINEILYFATIANEVETEEKIKKCTEELEGEAYYNWKYRNLLVTTIQIGDVGFSKKQNKRVVFTTNDRQGETVFVDRLDIGMPDTKNIVCVTEKFFR
jgi:predicted ATPase